MFDEAKKIEQGEEISIIRIFPEACRTNGKYIIE